MANGCLILTTDMLMSNRSTLEVDQVAERKDQVPVEALVSAGWLGVTDRTQSNPQDCQAQVD